MSCREMAPLLAERASGPLAPADEARVAGHLDGCASCRARAERLAAVLDLARAPSASAAEERLARDLPGRVVAAARRRPERRFGLGLGLGLGLASAAALAVAVVIPGRPGGRAAAPAAATLAAAGTAAGPAGEAGVEAGEAGSDAAEVDEVAAAAAEAAATGEAAAYAGAEAFDDSEADEVWALATSLELGEDY
jgi:hypothetical protein